MAKPAKTCPGCGAPRTSKTCGYDCGTIDDDLAHNAVSVNCCERQIAALRAKLREAETERDGLQTMRNRMKACIEDHENDCACLPEDVSVTEYVTGLQAKLQQAETERDGLREAAKDAEYWLSTLPLEPVKLWSVPIHEERMNNTAMPLGKLRAALARTPASVRNATST